MATLGSLHAFVPNTAAKATEVNANFNTVKAFIEDISTGVNIDAGVITESKLALGAVTETKISSTAITLPKLSTDVVNLFTPVGSIVQYAGVAEPTGWKFCNGQALPIASYTDLYNALTSNGTVFRFGANPTGSTFLLPNLKGRLPIGLDSSQTEFDVIGETGGSKNIAESNLPAHTHAAGTLANGDNGSHDHDIATTTFSATKTHPHNNLYDYVSAGTNGEGTSVNTNSIAAAGNHSHTISGSTAATGSGAVFLPPYLVINYLIKVS